MTSEGARSTIFRLAEVEDTGGPVKAVFRKAARRLHPDLGEVDAEAFKLLELAKSVLQSAGLYV